MKITVLSFVDEVLNIDYTVPAQKAAAAYAAAAGCRWKCCPCPKRQLLKDLFRKVFIHDRQGKSRLKKTGS